MRASSGFDDNICKEDCRYGVFSIDSIWLGFCKICSIRFCIMFELPNKEPNGLADVPLFGVVEDVDDGAVD